MPESGSADVTSLREQVRRARTDFCSVCEPHCSGESRYERVRHGRRVCPARRVRAHVDMRHDQRWRERPRLDALGSLDGQDTGVVHAIVGSPTATPTPTMTAAQSAASVARLRQGAAIQALAPSARSRSHQGRENVQGGCRDQGAKLTRFSLRPPLGPHISVHRAGELEVLVVQ